MAFPGPKVHRVSRRKLGRGQMTSPVVAMVTPTAATDVATLVFSQPVIWSMPGTVPTFFTCTGIAAVSAVQTSSTQIAITFAASVAAAAYKFVQDVTITQANGGAIAPASGTF